MKVAALDLGSNTSLLLIAEVDGGGIQKVFHDETRVTKMGQGVHANRSFHPEALARLDSCFADYARLIARIGCDKIVAVATSAARDVKNGEELLRLGAKHKLPIHIISGPQEAQLTFRGALSDRADTRGIAVIDVGGGSTEIISEVGSSEGPRGTSVDVGSVRLTEMFVTRHPTPQDELNKIEDYVRAAFARAMSPATADVSAGPARAALREVVAVAGTPTTLAALEQGQEFSEEKVHGFRLTTDHLDKWISRLQHMTVEERERLPGMQPKRADVIVSGSIILRAAMRALGQQQATGYVTVSTRGVRYGVALAWQDF